MRAMPIGDTKSKMLSKYREGDSKGMFDVWANSRRWHNFIDKCGLLLMPKYHKVVLFSEYVGNPWKDNTTLHIDYDWLKEEFEINTIPEYPKPKYSDTDFYPYAVYVNPWEMPGQRVLENFVDLTNIGKEGEL